MYSLLVCCALFGADPAKPDQEAPQAAAQSEQAGEPYWGLDVVNLDQKNRLMLGKLTGRACPATGGAIVRAVAEGGPASAAQLQPGDVIVGVDGKSVRDMKALAGVMARSKQDQSVELQIMCAEAQPAAATPPPRSGRRNPQMAWNRKTVTLTVGSLNKKQEVAGSPAKEDAGPPAKEDAGPPAKEDAGSAAKEDAGPAVKDDANSPLKIVGAMITRSPTGERGLAIRALVRKDIEAYEIEAAGFDRMGGVVNEWAFADSTHTLTTRASIPKGAYKTDFWMMRSNDALHVLKCKVRWVQLKDGSHWRPSDDKPVVFEVRVQRR